MGLSIPAEYGDSDLPELLEPLCGLYPGLKAFSPDYGPADYREWVTTSNGDPVPASLMLVLQDTVRDRPAPGLPARAVHTLAGYPAVVREIALQGALFDRDRPLEGLICAPGIAAGWSREALYELAGAVQEYFAPAPRACSRWCACLGDRYPPMERLQLLRVLGFNRVRFRADLAKAGPDKPARRLDKAALLLVQLRELGFSSRVLDLSLPARPGGVLLRQLESCFEQNRVECLRLRLGDDTGDSAVAALRNRILPGLGYRHIGLDWFVTSAEPTLGGDRTLYWSALGYTDIEALDMIGIGPGAVSVLEDAAARNTPDPETYQRLVAGDEIPVTSGVELEADDSLRRSVMAGLLVQERFDIAQLEERWGILFSRYFETEMEALRSLERAGKLMLEADAIKILARDRASLLALCRVFDRQHHVARVLPFGRSQPAP